MNTPTEKELRELDAWLAEHVMGLKRTESPDDSTDSEAKLFWHRKGEPHKPERILISEPYRIASSRKYGHNWTAFSPTTNPADAMAALSKVLDKIGDKTGLSIYRAKDGYALCWDESEDIIAPTLELAICRFIRKVFEK